MDRTYAPPAPALGAPRQTRPADPADNPRSPSGIRDTISFTEDALNQIHAAISQLDSRLDPVLLPVLPAPGGGACAASAPGPAMSDVRGRIVAVNAGLIDAIGRLNVLRDRVEV